MKCHSKVSIGLAACCVQAVRMRLSVPADAGGQLFEYREPLLNSSNVTQKPENFKVELKK